MIAHWDDTKIQMIQPAAACLPPRCTLNSTNNSHYWGRILGRNPDKSPKSFPPCYSQSPLQLFLFLQTHATLTVSSVQLLYTKGERLKKSVQKLLGSELSRLCPETSTKPNCAFTNSASVPEVVNFKTVYWSCLLLAELYIFCTKLIIFLFWPLWSYRFDQNFGNLCPMT